jgi:hypothetical protein
MGHLTVYSEAGLVPHAGCYLEYDYGRPPEWLGFEPNAGLVFDSKFGVVDTSDQSSYIGNFIRFKIYDKILYDARLAVVTQYLTEIYCFGVNDCCTFAKDLAYEAGLITPLAAYFPTHLVYALKAMNSGYEWNPSPPPWQAQ